MNLMTRNNGWGPELVRLVTLLVFICPMTYIFWFLGLVWQGVTDSFTGGREDWDKFFAWLTEDDI